MLSQQVHLPLAVFAVCAAGLFYIYIGYPSLIWLLARFRSHPARRQGLPEDFPTCSLVIPCFREGAALRVKVAQFLDSPSALHVQEIVIGFDGPPAEGESTVEDLQALVRSHGPGGTTPAPVPALRVVVFPHRRGKASVLNDLASTASGEVLVLSDARQVLHPEAIGQLLANFADPSVGVVSGELVLESGSEGGAASRGLGFYWRYEKFIRRCEGRYRSVPGATGALYAIRRHLFSGLPAVTILDDVVIPMLAMQQGCRCVFEPAAEVYDAPSASVEQESLRKRRTIAGAAQLIRLFPQWLLPWRNPIWLEYVSHKLLRLASPLLLVGLAGSNLALLERPSMQAFGAVQAAFYGAALVGGLAQRSGHRAVGFGIPLMFVALNATTALALWDALRGRFRVAWSK